MLAMLAAAALAVSAPPPAPIARLDAVVAVAAARGFAGEVRAGDAHVETYARAVPAPGRPHAKGDLWRWASVTKQVTATLALQAVAQGRLSLDDTLDARLPAFHGPTAREVTVRMLLQHTSGLPNPDDTAAPSPDALPAFYLRTDRGAGGPADALGYCAGPPKGRPGAGFAYDNCDYLVLGAILERAYGQPYALLVRERIARPAGLSGLRVATAGARLPAGLTRGVTATGAPEPRFVLATFGAAGAAYGRADDLVGFDQALLDHRLLDAASSELAWRGDPKLGYVALGAWGFPARLRGCAGPVRLVERRGEIGGGEVRNLLAPDLGRLLVVFADRSDLDFGEVWRGEGLTYDLASAAFCPAPPPP